MQTTKLFNWCLSLLQCVWRDQSQSAASCTSNTSNGTVAFFVWVNQSSNLGATTAATKHATCLSNQWIVSCVLDPSSLAQLATIKNLFGSYVCTKHNNHVRVIRKLKCVIKIGISFEYVKRNQDDNVAAEDLPIMAQINT